MRLIDADALEIDMVIEEAETPLMPWYPSNMPMRKTSGVSIEQIDNAPTIDALPRWIPCEERLPEKPKYYPHCEIHEVYYLVSLKNGFVIWNTYDFGKGAWRYTESPVIAWMPLPEPYGGERKDNECMERNDDARRSNEYE